MAIIMMMLAMLDDPVNSLAIWATLAFLLWVLLTLLVQRFRMPHSIVITASLSWIVTRLFLSLLPTVIHHVGLWFGT